MSLQGFVFARPNKTTGERMNEYEPTSEQHIQQHNNTTHTHKKWEKNDVNAPNLTFKSNRQSEKKTTTKHTAPFFLRHVNNTTRKITENHTLFFHICKCHSNILRHLFTLYLMGFYELSLFSNWMSLTWSDVNK